MAGPVGLLMRLELSCSMNAKCPQRTLLTSGPHQTSLKKHETNGLSHASLRTAFFLARVQVTCPGLVQADLLAHDAWPQQREEAHGGKSCAPAS